MVFCPRGPSGFYNPKTNKYIEKEGNTHFHVNIKCLWGEGIAIEQHTILYDDTLCQLDRHQMIVLNTKGFLLHMACKKV